MSGQIEFTNLSDDQQQRSVTSIGGDANVVRRKSGEITPLKDFSYKNRPVSTLNRVEGLRTMVLLFIIVSFGITLALAVELVIGESQVKSHMGVASLSETCSMLGVDLMKQGGNAVDAAIGAMLCLSVVEPQSAGLGGGGFMVIHDHNDKNHPTTILDFREVAPIRASPELFARLPNNDDLFLRNGGLSVGVPGELAGIHKAHSMYRSLSWGKIFAPVIQIAEHGFAVSEKLARAIPKRLAESSTNFEEFRKIFLKNDGSPYKAGDKMIRSDLAAAYRQLADSKDPIQLFYKGKFATEIVDAVNKYDGIFSADDLRTYEVIEREPLVGNFNGYTVVTTPAPSSGSLLLYILNKMEAQPDLVASSPEYFMYLSKVLQNAYKCRARLGDPNSSRDVSVNEALIANKSLLNEMDVCETTPSISTIEDHGTAHVSVIDKNDMIVSFTSTLNYLLGSLIVTKSGILLNNEMADFSHPLNTEYKYNQIAPKRRPLSSMVPTVIYHENRPCLHRISIGGLNGTRTTSSVAETIINIQKFGMSAKEAVDSPKLFCNEMMCEIENFDDAEKVAAEIKRQHGVDTVIVTERLAGVGAVTKFKMDVDGYFDEFWKGNFSQY